MARTVTGQQAADLAAARRRSFWRVRVQDADGTWVNLSNLDGKNYVQRASGRTSLGQNVATATVELIRSAGGLKSLSPLREDSDHNQVSGGYAPLLDSGRAILVEAGVVAPGATIQESDYQELFRGEIQKFSANKSPIRLELVGQGHKLVQAKIRTDSRYGTEAGRPMEDVAQDIIDDWGPSGVTIYTPTSPSFAVTPYLVDEQSVFDAQLQLWALRGYTLAYRWDDGTGAFRLTAYEPDRTKTAIDWTFPANRILNVRRLDVDRTDIINSLDVEFRNAATGQRETVSGTDADSIARFGEQWAAIRLSDDSPVNTTAEATTLLNAALSDMAYPSAEFEVEVPFHWAVQIGDMCRLGPDGRGFSVAQDQAVTQVDWTLSGDTRRTVLGVRGKPAGQYLRYRQLIREARERAEDEGARRVSVELEKMEWSDTLARFRLLWGSEITHVELWDRTYRLSTLPSDPAARARFTEPADDAADYDDVLFPGDNDDVLEFSIPQGDRVRFVTIRPRLAGQGAKGQGFHFGIYPTQADADAIHAAEAKVIGHSGAVQIPVTADPRVASIACAYNVGAEGSVEPPAVSAAELRNGTGATGTFVLPITGSDVFALPAGTVGDGQAFAAVLIGYLATGGVGEDGHRDDHGEAFTVGPVAREKPLVEWTAIDIDDSDPETGYISATLSDPGGYITSIVGQTKTGEGAWSSESPVSAAPASGTEYILEVPKQRDHQSTGRMIARGIGPANEPIEYRVEIGGFDYGLEPNAAFFHFFDEDAGTMTGVALCDPDCAGGGVKLFARKNGAVLEAEVDAATTVTPASGLHVVPSDFGTILSGLAPGDLVTVAWKGVAEDGTLQEDMGYLTIPFGTIAATLELTTVDEDRGAGTVTVGFTVRDDGGQADDLYIRVREGSATYPSSYGAAVASPPLNGVEYQEVLDLLESQWGSQAEGRLEQTIRGKLRPITLPSPVFHVGDQPRIYGARPILDRETGEVTAQGSVFFGVSYVKILVTTNGTAPTLANCRLEDPVYIPANAAQFTPADILTDLGSEVLATASLGDLIQLLILPYDADDNEGPEFRDEELFDAPVELEVDVTMGDTNLTIQATVSRDGVPVGVIQWRNEGGSTWLTDFDGDAANEATETALRARPSAGSDPTWVELRGLVDGRPTEVERVPIPAQAATQPVSLSGFAAEAVDDNTDVDFDWSWQPGPGVVDGGHNLATTIRDDSGTEITTQTEGSPASVTTDSYTQVGAGDGIADRYVIEARLKDDVSGDTLDLRTVEIYSTGGL